MLAHPSGDLNKRLSALPTMNKDELGRSWRELFETDPPTRMRSLLMIRMIAYRLQEQAFGSLSAADQRRLTQIAQKVWANPTATLTAMPRIKAGTRLVRRWQARTHVVTVNANSYEYRDSQYGSLSEIARLITGSRWSGPLFFGLKDKQKAVVQTKDVA